MGDSTPTDERDARPRPIVAIPYSRSYWVLSTVLVMFLLSYYFLIPAAVAWFGARRDQVKLDFGPGAWMQLLWPMALPMALALVLFAVFGWIASRLPAFAVYREGIKLNSQRLPPGRSRWDLGSYGFYSWSEVTSCRWSPYQPGMLSVHLAAVADQRDVVLTGPPSAGQIQMPPMIHFYRVPEPHRAAVEAAIRACGKWADRTVPT
jgi:hypothetical protein